MRIALAYYPLHINWNHGCAVLSSFMQRSGIDADIVQLCEGFTGAGYDAVCVNFVTVHDYKAARKICEGIAVPKYAGGVYARKGGQVVGFGKVCRGEGEKLPDFFMYGDESVFDRQLVDDDIDIFPDLSGVTGYEFGRGVPFLEGYKLIPYSNSRGCPYKCSFCEVKNLPRRVRIKTSIRRDLDRLRKEHDPDMFYFTDETLPYYNERWRNQFEGNHTPFLSFIRADIEKDHLQFLVDNGLIACAIGVESGDEEYRNSVLNKGVSDKQIFETIEMLDKHCVDRIMLYMRNSPGETDEMKIKTLDMVEALGGYAMIHEYEVL